MRAGRLYCREYPFRAIRFPDPHHIKMTWDSSIASAATAVSLCCGVPVVGYGFVGRLWALQLSCHVRRSQSQSR